MFIIQLYRLLPTYLYPWLRYIYHPPHSPSAVHRTFKRKMQPKHPNERQIYQEPRLSIVNGAWHAAECLAGGRPVSL